MSVHELSCTTLRFCIVVSCRIVLSVPALFILNILDDYLTIRFNHQAAILRQQLPFLLFVCRWLTRHNNMLAMLLRLLYLFFRDTKRAPYICVRMSFKFAIQRHACSGRVVQARWLLDLVVAESIGQQPPSVCCCEVETVGSSLVTEYLNLSFDHESYCLV